MSAVEIVRGTTATGNPRLRAVAADGDLLAVAINVDGRWEIGTYDVGTPNGQLSAHSESDAREWVAWIGEQMLRARRAVDQLVIER